MVAESLTAEEALEGKASDMKPARPDFPVRYQQHSTSGLEYPVGAGENVIDIGLKP